MRERGAKINPSLGLYPDPQAGMGLIATGELEPDEALLFIPPRLQLRWWRGTEAEAAVGAAWEPPSEQLALQELVAAEVPASMWDFRLTCLLRRLPPQSCTAGVARQVGGACRAVFLENSVFSASLSKQMHMHVF